MDREGLITLTADIVAADVSNNNVAISDMPGLVARVHQALEGLGRPGEQTEEKRAPAVSVRSSVKPDSITCLVCGKMQKTMKRHLTTAHDMSPAEYRAEFDLPAGYPLTAPNYSKRRQELAVKAGLGRKRKAKAPSAIGRRRRGTRAG